MIEILFYIALVIVMLVVGFGAWGWIRDEIAVRRLLKEWRDDMGPRS